MNQRQQVRLGETAMSFEDRLPADFEYGMPRVPEDGEIRVRYASQGLPIVEWLEGEGVPHVCYVAVRNNKPLFVSWQNDSNRYGVGSTLIARTTKAVFSVATGLSLLMLLIVLLLESRRDWPTAGQVILGGLVNVVFLSFFLMFPVGWWVKRQIAQEMKAGADWGKGRLKVGPWAELSEFSVEQRSPDNVPRHDYVEILAGFGSGGSSFPVSLHNWSEHGRAELHRVLMLEFIEQREEHLKRIAAAERVARNTEISERRKVV
jgi:hypothetical protein